MKKILAIAIGLTVVGCASLPSWLSTGGVAVTASDAGITVCATVAADLRDAGSQ